MNIQGQIYKSWKKSLNRIKEKMYKKEEERMMTEIQMCNPEAKIRTYKPFKTTSGMEPYLLINSLRPSHMYTIARLRLSSHTLGIETGRHKKTKVPVEQQKYRLCDSGMVEDDQHLLICVWLQTLYMKENACQHLLINSSKAMRPWVTKRNYVR